MVGDDMSDSLSYGVPLGPVPCLYINATVELFNSMF